MKSAQKLGYAGKFWQSRRSDRHCSTSNRRAAMRNNHGPSNRNTATKNVKAGLKRFLIRNFLSALMGHVIPEQVGNHSTYRLIMISRHPRMSAMPFSRSFVALATVLLCGCSSNGKDLSTSNSTAVTLPATQAQIAKGLAFVDQQCSGCHAVRPGYEPANSQAPSFLMVANNMQFNQASLREFFRDRHDSPDSMSIYLNEDDAEIAAAYIMSLRSAR